MWDACFGSVEVYFLHVSAVGGFTDGLSTYSSLCASSYLFFLFFLFLFVVGVSSSSCLVLVVSFGGPFASVSGAATVSEGIQTAGSGSSEGPQCEEDADGRDGVGWVVKQTETEFHGSPGQFPVVVGRRGDETHASVSDTVSVQSNISGGVKPQILIDGAVLDVKVDSVRGEGWTARVDSDLMNLAQVRVKKELMDTAQTQLHDANLHETADSPLLHDECHPQVQLLDAIPQWHIQERGIPPAEGARWSNISRSCAP